MKYLVVDLRHNGGGSSDLYKPLIQKILASEINKKGQLFGIIGRVTFSAAMNFTTDLEYWTNVTRVGEPTSSSPNFIGESRIFHLPYSNLRISLSDRMHQGGAGSSADRRIWVAPEIAIPLSSTEFAKGVDPAMDWILKNRK